MYGNRHRYRGITTNQTRFVTTCWHIIACNFHKTYSSLFVAFCNGKGTRTCIGCWHLNKLYYISLACLSILYLETQLTCWYTVERVVRRLEVQRFIPWSALCYYHGYSFALTITALLCYIISSTCYQWGSACQRTSSCGTVIPYDVSALRLQRGYGLATSST